MEASSGLTRSENAVRTRADEIDWDAYASHYDLLAANNPSYLENIEILRSLLPKFGLPENAVVCDLGAGTGNFICALARELPNARFLHVDADTSMNEVASRKYSLRGINRVDVHCCSATEATYSADSFDLIVCVNALYSMAPQKETLNRIRTWLKPTGTFFVIDYGRQVKVLNWVLYVLRHVFREQGVRAAIKLLKNSVENIRQNRRGSQGQADGVYWLHSTEEFGRALEEAGFVVDVLRPCYRGYSDLAVCRMSPKGSLSPS